MEKEFIEYEQAIALKELGFDEPCFGWYNQKGILLSDTTIGYDSEDYSYTQQTMVNEQCSAPLYQQAFKWFRKNYGLEHKIIRDSYGCRYQITKVTRTSMEEIDCKGQLSNTSYDEAELECLKKLIEIVKKQKKDESNIIV